jgi:hypothetical protein
MIKTKKRVIKRRDPMLTPQHVHGVVEESIRAISGHSGQLNQAHRLADVGIHGARLYALSDLISLKLRSAGHMIDTHRIRGHVSPNLSVSDLTNFVQTAFAPPPGAPGARPDRYICLPSWRLCLDTVRRRHPSAPLPPRWERPCKDIDGLEATAC